MRRRHGIELLLIPLVAVALLGAVLVWHGQTGDARTIAVGAYPDAVSIDAQAGRAFVTTRGASFGNGGGADNVSVVDLRSGKVLGAMMVGPDPRAVVLDSRHNQVLVANDDDASVTVLDPRTGTLLRTIAVGARPHALTLDASRNRAYVVNTGDDSVSILDTRRRVVLRTVPIGDPLDAFGSTSVVVDSRAGRVFVIGVGTIAILDARSGAVLRHLTINGLGEHLALETASDHLLAARQSGVQVIDTRDGRLLGAFTAGCPPTAVAVDNRNQRIWVTCSGPVDRAGTPLGAGRVSVLDARRGTIVWTGATGVAPVALAVDERTGQAVVVNAGGQVRVRDAWSWIPSALRRWLPFLGSPATTRDVPGSISIVAAPR